MSDPLTNAELVKIAILGGLGCEIEVSEKYPDGILWYDGNVLKTLRAVMLETQKRLRNDTARC